MHGETVKFTSVYWRFEVLRCGPVFQHSPSPTVSDLCLPVFTPFIFKFFSTSSLPLLRGLSLLLFPFIIPLRFFDIHLFLIISFSWEAFVLFTVSTPYDISFISLFVLILQRSPALIGQYIFRTIFCSDILSAFVSCIVVIQAFGPSVSMGHNRVLYTRSFNLVLRDRNCDLKSLIYSLYAWFAVIILEWISVHFSFSLFTLDPKYVKLSTRLSLKSPIFRFWRCCLPCLERQIYRNVGHLDPEYGD